MNPERRNRRIAAAVIAIIVVVVLIVVLIPRDVTVTCEGEGTVSPDGGSIRFYESLDISMEPAEEWHVGTVEVDGQPIVFGGDTLRYSVSIFDFSHHHVHVTFVEDTEPVPEPETHTVTVTHTSGGSVEPSGTVEVNDGDSLTIEIDPDAGYRLSSLQVDGRRVASGVASYTLEEITEDHTVHAVFSRTSSPGGGTSTPRLVGIEVTKQPDNLNYSVGTVFDPTGMEVTAHYSNGSSHILEDSEYTWSPSRELTTEDDTITVTHRGMTDTVSITVLDDEAFNVIVESYYGTRMENGIVTEFSEEPETNLGSFEFDTRGIVPGIQQTVVLRVTNGTGLDLDAFVFVEDIVKDSGEHLAKQLLLSASHGSTASSGSLDRISSGEFLDLGMVEAGTTITVTVTLDFPNLPENNDTMGETVSFGIGISAYEKNDAPTP